MSTTTVLILVFAATALLAAGAGSLVYDLFLRHNSRINERIESHFRDPDSNASEQSLLFKDLNRLASDVASSDINWRSRLDDFLQQSGLNITPRRLLTLCSCAGLLAAIVVASASRSWFGVVAVIPGFLLPITYVVTRQRMRIQKLCTQLPEAFEVMSRSVRAGQTVPGALQIVANDFDVPIRDEFAYCYEQQNLGISQDVALRELARRTGVMELQMFVVAMIVQRRSGGNLIELLDNLASIVRKRLKLRGRVRALTAEGRLQALVLICLPTAALAALFFLNRSYAQVLLDRPALLGGTLTAQAVGALWIRRIINFDY